MVDAAALPLFVGPGELSMRADESEIEMFVRWHLYRRWKQDQGRASIYDFRRYIKSAPAGALALDCGANVGHVTKIMLDAGMHVIAFEPDRNSFARLRQRFRQNPRVTLIDKAIGASNRTVPFFHEMRKGTVYSEGSSIQQMGHHAPGSVYDVEVIDIVEFIGGLADPIHLMKIDIEGAEAEVLEALLDAKLLGGIGQVYAELHDWLDQDLAARLAVLRRRIAESGLRNVDLNWG